ncbi:MAG TPA: YHS domain-containing protein [Nitrososphaerales archaeon]|nr:YHS domain-containing protein [Nitrososphaerales archaeon]
MPKDPVCGMTVDDKAALSSEHEGRVIYFCSQGCKNTFDRNPQKYVRVG